MKRSMLAIGSAVVVLAAGTAGVEAAARHHDGPAATFQHRLAERLGVSDAKLRAATRAAARDTVETLRKEGRIGAARAQRLERRLGRVRFGRRAYGLHAAAVRAEAGALGIDRRELRTELHAGRAPAAVVRAHGKDPATVASAIRSALARRAAPRRAQRIAARLTGETPLRAR